MTHFVRWVVSTVLFCLVGMPAAAGGDDADPLVVGETFTLASKVLDEDRRINVYQPTFYGTPITDPMGVLYMPDGGITEDFLHIAGLVQISVANGTMRPLLLVGIENTERRRDLTGPSEVAEDKAIAPRIGGSAAFREFIRTELMPHIKARYDVTDEAAIVGESLAGLFVVETFFEEPELFDTYIAVDPSLWWNKQSLVNSAGKRLGKGKWHGTALYLASSSEQIIGKPVRNLVEALREHPGELRWHYDGLPEESHATIYHPAAVKAFRTVLAPAAK